MVQTVIFDLNARPLGTPAPQTTTLDTPETDISDIQSGRIQPLPAYTEAAGSLFRPLNSTVDPSDTRHIPPTYTEEITPLPAVHENSSILFDSKNDTLKSKGNDGDSISKTSRPTDSAVTPFPSADIQENNSNSQGDEDADALYAKLLQEEEAVKERRNVIASFFTGISKEQQDVIDLFIARGLVTANTVDEDGQTPLPAAVKTKNIKIVQQLLDAGAEPDAFGVVEKRFDPHSYTFAESRYIVTKRTPLMLAAALGHLSLVKLLMERYACSDAKIAPDGQIALRLASSGGHREVVAYLPSRRGGGFLRWKTAHQKSLARAKRALDQLYHFIRFFVWSVPKFFVWTCPKEVIVKPLCEGCKYCWQNKGRFKNYCVSEIKKIPERTNLAAKACGRGLKKIPGFVADVSKATWRGIKKIPDASVKAAKWTKKVSIEAAKALWRFITVDVPKVSKKIGKWLFDLLFVRIPKATTIAAKWLWAGVVSVATSMWSIITRVVSVIHTFITSLSLKDILNGFKAVLEAVFVTFPKTLWSWIDAFGEVSWKVLKGLFGCVGMCIWCLIRGIMYLVNYIPRKVGTIFVALAQSLGKAFHEILVWFSPKA